MQELRPLSRPQSLTDAVVMYVRDAVINGELAPGQQLSEANLAQTLGTSRGTVREAMRVEKVFRDVDADGRRVHLFRAFACHAGRAPAYPSRPKEKTRAIKL